MSDKCVFSLLYGSTIDMRLNGEWTILIFYSLNTYFVFVNLIKYFHPLQHIFCVEVPRLLKIIRIDHYPETQTKALIWFKTTIIKKKKKEKTKCFRVVTNEWDYYVRSVSRPAWFKSKIYVNTEHSYFFCFVRLPISSNSSCNVISWHAFQRFGSITSC